MALDGWRKRARLHDSAATALFCCMVVLSLVWRFTSAQHTCNSLSVKCLRLDEFQDSKVKCAVVCDHSIRCHPKELFKGVHVPVCIVGLFLGIHLLEDSDFNVSAIQYHSVVFKVQKRQAGFIFLRIKCSLCP